MCDPVSATMAASALVGTGGVMMSNKAQNDAAESAGNYAIQEMKRQQGFQQKGLESFQGSLQAFQQPGNPADSSSRDAAVSGILDRAGPGLAIGLSNDPAVPGNVAAMRQKTVADGAAKGDQRAQLQRQAGAFADQMFERNLVAGRNALDIGMNNRNSQGSMGVLPLEQQAAMSGGYSMLGDVMQGVGNLGMMYGGMGAPGLGGRTVPTSGVAPNGTLLRNSQTGMLGGRV